MDSFIYDWVGAPVYLGEQRSNLHMFIQRFSPGLLGDPQSHTVDL